MKRNRLLTAIVALFATSPAIAQGAGHVEGRGIIVGRVFDPSRGVYVERARVTVAGTALETFTDAAGEYRITDVPAGTVKLNVFFTGSPLQTDLVQVDGGRTVEHNVTMQPAQGRGPEGAPIQLDAYTVTASRAMSGAAIAINEQRFAPNIKTVIAADEFETVEDGTPGEILKFLPGVSMDNTAGDARGVVFEGVGQIYTPITIGGFSLANTSAGATSRSVLLDNVGANNLARIEKVDSPTPESPANALAGTVDLIPRSAFEVPKPTYTATVFMTMKDDARDFHKTPGPFIDPERKVTPGFSFSAVVPLSKQVGFSISGNDSVQYAPENSAVSYWYGARLATNGTSLPHTTPENPYDRQFSMTDGARRQHNASLSFTLDWRITPADVVSVNFQKAYLASKFMVHWQNYVIGTPTEWGPTFTHGRAATGSFSQQTTMQITPTHTETPTMTYRHNGSVWKTGAGLGHSRSSQKSRSGDKGFFYTTTINNAVPVTGNFDNGLTLRPTTITFTDSAGTRVDPYNLGNYRLGNVTDMKFDRVSAKTSAYVNVSRSFDARGTPITIKAGLDARRDMRDSDSSTASYTYLGADRNAATFTADDAATLVYDPIYSQKMPPYGFPKTQWASAVKYYDLFKQHPNYFQLDENNLYRTAVSNSKYASETVSSAYLRIDASLFRRRLWLVGGARGEKTTVEAEGPLTDPTRNFARDAGGRFIDADPNRAGFQPTYIVPTSDVLGVSKATYLARQTRVKADYSRLFPSLNASFNITENLAFRTAYYHSIGRPDFNQYSGGLTLPVYNPDVIPTLTINNPAIKPWTANTLRVRLEYYFPKVGDISIAAFHRDFKNFFATETRSITPEELAGWDLDPDTWGNANLRTTYNLSEHLVTTGLIFDYKQALTFLPHWARGLQVFFNATALRSGSSSAQNPAAGIAGMVPRVYNYGASITRPKWKLSANWNFRSRTRVGRYSTGASMSDATYNFYPERLYLSLQGEYQLASHYWVFASIRNFYNTFTEFEAYGPQTPAYAHLYQRTDYSATWTLGLRGRW